MVTCPHLCGLVLKPNIMTQRVGQSPATQLLGAEKEELGPSRVLSRSMPPRTEPLHISTGAQAPIAEQKSTTYEPISGVIH